MVCLLVRLNRHTAAGCPMSTHGVRAMQGALTRLAAWTAACKHGCCRSQQLAWWPHGAGCAGDWRCDACVQQSGDVQRPRSLIHPLLRTPSRHRPVCVMSMAVPLLLPLLPLLPPLPPLLPLLPLPPPPPLLLLRACMFTGSTIAARPSSSLSSPPCVQRPSVGPGSRNIRRGSKGAWLACCTASSAQPRCAQHLAGSCSTHATEQRLTCCHGAARHYCKLTPRVCSHRQQPWWSKGCNAALFNCHTVSVCSPLPTQVAANMASKFIQGLQGGWSAQGASSLLKVSATCKASRQGRPGC